MAIDYYNSLIGSILKVLMNFYYIYKYNIELLCSFRKFDSY